MYFFKKKKIIFFLFILNSNSIFGLKNEDICSLVEKECQGRYNANHKYHVICDFKKCPISHSNRCGNEAKCTTSRKDCDEYLMLKSYKFQSKSFKSNQEIMLKSKMYLFGLLESTVQNCTKSEYKWSSRDVCSLFGNNCYQKEKIDSTKSNWFKIILQKNYNLKKVECKCTSNNHSYHCGKYYCSINKRGFISFLALLNINLNLFLFKLLKACDLFSFRDLIQPKALKTWNIKKCHENQIIFERNIMDKHFLY